MRLSTVAFIFQAFSFCASCFIVGAMTRVIRARADEQAALKSIFQAQKQLMRLQAERISLLEAAVYGAGDGNPAPARDRVH